MTRATLTMRLARPPRFMISPARMKNGTAINGKLSAPLRMFCATICASAMSSRCMSAMPQTSSANAIGIPSAMAPSSDKVKTAMVMGKAAARGSELFRFRDGHELGLARGSGQHADQVVDEDHAGREAEDHARGVE